MGWSLGSNLLDAFKTWQRQRTKRVEARTSTGGDVGNVVKALTEKALEESGGVASEALKALQSPEGVAALGMALGIPTSAVGGLAGILGNATVSSDGKGISVPVPDEGTGFPTWVPYAAGAAVVGIVLALVFRGKD